MLTMLIKGLVLTLAWAGLLPAAGLESQGLKAAEQAPAPQGATEEAPQPEAAASESIETADDLLRALETAGRDIRRMTADLRYVKTFEIQGDTQRRDGRLVFLSEPREDGETPDRRFAITFGRLEVGGRIQDIDTDYLERYVFDGEWLAEVRPLEKQFVRRQVVAPGDDWDPLRLGEGPFPIPIQQKREDILERFDAELLPGDEGVMDRGLQGVASKSYQLRLTPKVIFGDEDLRELRVWYERDTLLPRMARTITKADDEAYVLLKDIRLNEDAAIEAGEVSTEPPSDRSGWNISVEPFAERGG